MTRRGHGPPAPGHPVAGPRPSILRTAFRRSGASIFSGFAVDPADLARKFTVELLVDGIAVRTQRADSYVHELAEDRTGDGCYGFSFALPANTVRNGGSIEARLANIGTPIGSAIELGGRIAPDPGGPGEFRCLGGLRFSGWLGGPQGGEQGDAADVMVDGELVLRVRTSGWTQIGAAPEPTRAVKSFDFHLPDRFGDGCVHRVAMLTANGETLAGSPIAFVAFAGGLGNALAKAGGPASMSERQLAELFDRVEPMSLPLSRYQEWRHGLPAEIEPRIAMPCAVIMVGRGNMDDTMASLDQQTHADWVAAALPSTANAAGFDPQQLRKFLDADGRNCRFAVFGLAGTSFAPTALQRLAAVFQRFETVVAAYGDVDVAGTDGKLWPLAFPAFDYERMLEQGYCAHLFALRRSEAQAALAKSPTSLYRLFNVLLDENPLDRPSPGRDIVHVPGSLGILPGFDAVSARAALAAATGAHLQARGDAVRVTPGRGTLLPAVRVARHRAAGKVTIMIPTRNRLSLLQKCISSIGSAARRTGAKLLVIDNDSTDPDTLAYLAGINGKVADVMRIAGPFNFARINNIAAAAVESEFLCLLNNDIEASDDRWLSEMLSRIAPADVGAVGALLVYPSGIVQHGGVVLGPNFAATHASNDRTAEDPGYSDMLRIARQCSAVTAACLLTRRADYGAVGGMDEVRFPYNFNDVDYCLKLRAAGKRIVWTPHARLLHHESASRGQHAMQDHKQQFMRELASLRNRWGETLVDDPYYSPVLSLDPVPFSALASPLRNMAARKLSDPAPVEVPPGF
jgi:GT2 family glycosyltransferase